MVEDVLVVIPARYDSKRFPGKLMADLNGKPVIWHTLKALSAMVDIPMMVVTDHEEIVRVAQDFEFEVVVDNHEYLNGTERISASVINKSQDIIINIQADEIFVSVDSIYKLIELMKNNISVQIASICSNQASENPNVNCVKVILDESHKADDFIRTLPNQTCYSHAGIYAYRRDIIHILASLEPSTRELERSLEQLRWLDNGYEIQMLKCDSIGLSINTLEDLEKAREVIQ